MDSTSETDAEPDLQVRQQEVVAELGQQALRTDDLDQLMHDTTVAVAETLDAEYAKVLELLPAGDALLLRQGVGWREALIGSATVPTDTDSQAGYTLLSEQPVVVDDLRTEARFSGPDLLVDHEVVSGISVVIGPVEEPWGILGIHSTNRRGFRPEDATFIENVANVLAAAIDRVEMEQRLRDREHRLERYKEYTDDILAAVDDMFYVIDESGTFQRWNESLTAITGYSDAEVESMQPLEFFVEADREAVADAIAEIFDTGSSRVEADILTKSGDRIAYEFAASRLETPDGTPVVAGIGRNVTERKKRTREVTKYERIVETINDGIYVIDEDDRFTMVNDAYTDLTGYTRKELRGERVTRIIDEATLERAAERRAQMADDETISPTMEATVETKNGDRVPIEVTFASLPEDGGEKRVGVVRDITERKERERVLEESEARFRMLAENLDEMVWLESPDTRELYYVNPAAETIWGRDREWLYDNPASFLEAVHPNDRQRVEQAYTNVLDDGFDEEYRIVRPDGEIRWLDVRAVPVQNEAGKIRRIVGIISDITERTERERALEESERRYRTLVENFPNGAVGLFDDGLRYTAVGGELVDAVGISPEDRIGNSVYELYPDELVEEVEPYFKVALEGESNSFEIEYHDRHLFAHTLPVRNDADEVFAGMLVVQDVTERREYQRQLEESNERLEQFAYAASHDLQEPLRMISSYLQLLERRYEDALDEDGEDFLEFAVDGADRMRAMINSLLEYSRVNTQGDPLEPVDLDDVLDAAVDNLRMKIEEHDAKITVESLPQIQGDERQLQQVFQNLLSNGIEYSGDEPPRIHIGVERDEREWLISVRDEGIGIEPDDQDRVFEVFQRLHSHDKHAGTGIGLALCQRIVERHGGDIWVESEPGDGATFYFSLPPADNGDG